MTLDIQLQQQEVPNGPCRRKGVPGALFMSRPSTASHPPRSKDADVLKNSCNNRRCVHRRTVYANAMTNCDATNTASTLHPPDDREAAEQRACEAAVTAVARLASLRQQLLSQVQLYICKFLPITAPTSAVTKGDEGANWYCTADQA